MALMANNEYLEQENFLDPYLKYFKVGKRRTANLTERNDFTEFPK